MSSNCHQRKQEKRRPIRTSSPPSRDSNRQGPRRQRLDPLLYKTELCRSLQGYRECQYSDKCRFAHSIEELRPPVRHYRYRTQLCRNYHERGVCNYGSRCSFIHSMATFEDMKPPTIHLNVHQDVHLNVLFNRQGDMVNSENTLNFRGHNGSNVQSDMHNNVHHSGQNGLNTFHLDFSMRDDIYNVHHPQGDNCNVPCSNNIQGDNNCHVKYPNSIQGDSGYGSSSGTGTASVGSPPWSVASNRSSFSFDVHPLNQYHM
ncbi:hypothetical protein WDU94_012905 [Cyamophila willieti]